MSKLRERSPQIILFGTVFFALFPAFAKFQLLREFHDIEPLTALVLALTLGSIYILATLTAGPSKTKFSLAKNVAIALILFPPLAFLLTALTGPYLSTRIFGSNRVMHATVIHKSSGSGARASCKFSIAVRIDGFNHDSQQCLSRDFWENINVGDKVEIDAIVSRSGYIRKSIKAAAI